MYHMLPHTPKRLHRADILKSDGFWNFDHVEVVEGDLVGGRGDVDDCIASPPLNRVDRLGFGVYNFGKNGSFGYGTGQTGVQARLWNHTGRVSQTWRVKHATQLMFCGYLVDRDLGSSGTE